MNYRGSYRHLIRNAKAAMLAAIEIYNKPQFDYRDECFSILLINAWELALKALLSKSGRSIYYKKRRREPYRTLSWQDALGRAEPLFPKSLSPLPIRRNLELLATYRDSAVHFYNVHGFGTVVYALAQTSIINFRDLLETGFDIHLDKEINWQLMPLGLRPPIDALTYIRRGGAAEKTNPAVQQFLGQVAQATKEVADANIDTGRLLTVFTIKLESTKKIQQADVLVGVRPVAEDDSGILTIVRRQDPNVSHPLRQKEVVSAVGVLHGEPFTSHVFQAVLWKFGLKERAEYCWRANEGVLTKYSNEIVTFISRLSKADLTAAVDGYRGHLRSRAQAKNR